MLFYSESIIFDEVTGNIDSTMTTHIANVLLDLKTDHTIIMITHKPEMMDIADRVIVLDKGKLNCKGKENIVYEKSSLYKELKSRTFVSVSVNE